MLRTRKIKQPKKCKETIHNYLIISMLRSWQVLRYCKKRYRRCRNVLCRPSKNAVLRPDFLTAFWPCFIQDVAQCRLWFAPYSRRSPLFGPVDSGPLPLNRGVSAIFERQKPGNALIPGQSSDTIPGRTSVHAMFIGIVTICVEGQKPGKGIWPI